MQVDSTDTHLFFQSLCASNVQLVVVKAVGGVEQEQEAPVSLQKNNGVKNVFSNCPSHPTLNTVGVMLWVGAGLQLAACRQK